MKQASRLQSSHGDHQGAGARCHNRGTGARAIVKRAEHPTGPTESLGEATALYCNGTVLVCAYGLKDPEHSPSKLQRQIQF